MLEQFVAGTLLLAASVVPRSIRRRARAVSYALARRRRRRRHLRPRPELHPGRERPVYRAVVRELHKAR